MGCLAFAYSLNHTVHNNYVHINIDITVELCNVSHLLSALT